MKQLLLSSLFSLLICLSAQAQVELRLTPDRRAYLEREGIGLNLTITNRSGSDLQLKTIDQTSWLDFKVTNQAGEVISPVRRELFQRIVVPRGTTIAKRIPLSRFYALDRNGQYSVRANVLLPEAGNRRFISNAAHFTIFSAPSFWSKRVGVPKGEPSSGNIRRYSLKRAVVDRINRLFVELDDETTNQTIKVMQLGQALATSEPTVLVDGEQTLHVLFQNTGVLFVHSRVNIHGEYLGHEIHKRTTTKPTLVFGADGIAEVIGGTPFDPKAEQEAKTKIRRLSERPAFHYR